MSAPVSLLIGSTALGLVELGDKAVLGQMTKAMPGGDGSLEFSLLGTDVEAARNVLQPGARVKLGVGGAGVWAGKLLTDPLRQRLSSPGSVTIAAGGLNAWAARAQDYGYAGWDRQTANWRRVRQKYNTSTSELEALAQQQRFTADTDGRLRIEGDDNRSYDGYSMGRLAYWLFAGADTDHEIVRVDLTYKCNLPTSWHLRLRSTTGTPWSYDSVTSELDETTSRSSWYDESITLTLDGAKSVFLDLQNGSSTDTPTSSPWVTVKSVTVFCRSAAARIHDVLADVATLDGLATVTDIDFLSSVYPDELMLPPDGTQTPADVLRTLVALIPNEVEHGFYLDAAGADAYYAKVLSSTPDAARNRTWSYGGRAGESTDGLERDYETAPEYVVLVYQNQDDVTLPPGTVKRVYHPSAPTSSTERVQVVSEYAEQRIADTAAASLADRHWTRRQYAQFTGEVPLPATLVDASGVERPGWQLVPGDRLHCPGLDTESDLYVAETAWDWRSMTGTATVGWPFDPPRYMAPRNYGRRPAALDTLTF